MTSDQSPPAESHPDLDHLATALKVTEDIVAGVRPEQAHLPTPCDEYDVARLLDHLVGFATNFADKANGVTPAADPTRTTAGTEPQTAYHEAAARLIGGYRDGASDDATPLGVVLMETITHGWDLAAATGQQTPYPAEAAEAALVAGRRMLAAPYRGAGKPFGEEVEVPSSAPALDRLVGFMGRNPDWSG